jgi:hypothetical protein
VLKYNKDHVTQLLEQNTTPLPEDGIEDSFEVMHEIPEKYTSLIIPQHTRTEECVAAFVFVMQCEH